MPRYKDLTGLQFGDFTVIEMLKNFNGTHRTYCRCIGIDDNEYIIRQDALHSGATKYIKGACSAGKAEDLSNQKFGKLIALYPTSKRSSNHNIIWVCRCDCGNSIEVSSGNLKRGHTTSCGCNKSSKREKMIIRILRFYHISFIKEKTFDDCKNTKGNMNLYFDFYLPGFNVIIEYDGVLHTEESKCFGGAEKLRKTIEADNIKNEYCKTHGIKMIRIPYTKTNKEIKQIIKQIICP